MSRGDELRKKFAAKTAANPFDELKADFKNRLDRFLASERSASAASAAFVDSLYAEFKAQQPSDIDAWFRQKLTNQFVSVDLKPVWIFEPSWVFENGVPLEFLHQFSDEGDTSFYVFRGYREGSLSGVEGKLRFLKLVAQKTNGILLLEGSITG